MNMTPKRTLPSVITTTIPIPFTPTIQGTIVVLVPTLSEVVLHPQLVITDVCTYQDIYAVYNVKTPDGDSAAIVKWITFHGDTQQTYAIDNVNGIM